MKEMNFVEEFVVGKLYYNKTSKQYLQIIGLETSKKESDKIILTFVCNGRVCDLDYLPQKTPIKGIVEVVS